MPIMDTLLARLHAREHDYDLDDLWRDNKLPEDAPIGPLAGVPSGDGVSSIRFADVRGKHEWIASTATAGAELRGAHHRRGDYNQTIALFHALGGHVIVDDVCIAEADLPAP